MANTWRARPTGPGQGSDPGKSIDEEYDANKHTGRLLVERLHPGTRYRVQYLAGEVPMEIVGELEHATEDDLLFDCLMRHKRIHPSKVTAVWETTAPRKDPLRPVSEARVF